MRKRTTVFCLLLTLMITEVAWAVGDGVPIIPDEQGRFEYADDFKTPRFLVDGFTDNLGPVHWHPGELVHHGPTHRRSLTYRFYGRNVINGFHVHIEQMANSRSLGGRNDVYLSRNGLDWRQATTSSSLPSDHNQYQRDPLVIDSKDQPDYRGGTELWVRD